MESRRRAVCLALLFLAGAALLPACGGCRSSLPTVDGPEAEDLVKGVSGYLIMGRPRGEMAALLLPTLEEVMLREPAPDDQHVFSVAHSVSGPDDEGRIAYIDDYFFTNREEERRHVLKIMRLSDKKEQEVFSRPGSMLFTRHVGRRLALAPTGGQVAFISNHTAVVHDPPVLHGVGTLEIWDVTRRTGQEVDVVAYDDQMSWFPDGKRLAYVELLSRQDARTALDKLSNFGSGFKTWEKVPAVHVLDTDTGKRTFLHLGWVPQVSVDGKTVLVADSDYQFRLIDVESGKSEAADWPGKWRQAIALLEERRVLYWGLRTSGSPVRYTNLGSQGPSQLFPLKLAEINSSKFQTVVPHLDGRFPVSFGVVKKRP